MNFFFFFVFRFSDLGWTTGGKKFDTKLGSVLGKNNWDEGHCITSDGQVFPLVRKPPRGCEENPEPVLVCLMRCHVVKIDCFVTRTASCDKVGKVSFASYWLPAHIVPRGVFRSSNVILYYIYTYIYMDKPLIYR